MSCLFVCFKLSAVVPFLILATFLYSFIRSVGDTRCSGTLSASLCLASGIFPSQIFSDRSLNLLPVQVSEKSLPFLFASSFSSCLFTFQPPDICTAYCIVLNLSLHALSIRSFGPFHQ